MLHVPTFLAGSFDIGRCSVVLELRCHDGRRYSGPGEQIDKPNQI